MATAKLSDQDAGSRAATVLVVEDEPLLRYALVCELSDAGFEVLEAASTDEAEAVLSSQGAVDLVMTDIQMPGARDGIVLAEIVRATRPEIKIIIASGCPTTSDLSALADAIFIKPYDFGGVVGKISSMIETRENA